MHAHQVGTLFKCNHGMEFHTNIIDVFSVSSPHHAPGLFDNGSGSMCKWKRNGPEGTRKPFVDGLMPSLSMYEPIQQIVPNNFLPDFRLYSRTTACLDLPTHPQS